MSNRIEDDPIGHTSKFLWILALVPLIFEGIALATPPPASGPRPWWIHLVMLVPALLLVALGYGVHRRSLGVIRAGMVVFGLGAVVVGVLGLLHRAHRVSLLPALLLGWVVVKLHTVAQTLEGRSPAP